MKLLLLPILSGICMLPLNSQIISEGKDFFSSSVLPANSSPENILNLNFQAEPGVGHMAAIAFRNQDYCRAELKDFEFDARFTVLSATVYFSGKNFDGVKRGVITSSSLKPIKDLMKQCQPGSQVVFDDVKVKGPDNQVRTIPGVALTLF